MKARSLCCFLQNSRQNLDTKTRLPLDKSQLAKKSTWRPFIAAYLRFLRRCFPLRPRTRSHQEYQVFVLDQFRRQYIDTGQLRVLLLHANLIAKLWYADLSPVFSLLLPRYSKSERGAPPWDPVVLFRCWLCMTLAGYTSANEWVVTMRTVPLCAILCGCEPAHTPGVGTLYDFQHRLWLAEKVARRQRRRKHGKPRRKGRKGEKLDYKRPGVIKRLVDRLERDRCRLRPQRPDSLLQEIFRDAFVRPSAQKGLLGDVGNLVLAGDSTPIRTGASPYGKRICNCKEQGIKSCQCPRAYSDPDASMGWDSYRGCWFYGRHLYEWNAADSPYDLPVYFRLVAGRRHDSVSGVVTLDECQRLHVEWTVGAVLLDSAHDNYPTYQMLHNRDITAVIDLNPRAAGKAVDTNTYKPGEGITLNAEGVPVCAADKAMRYNGFCKGRGRHKWRCPLKPNLHPEQVVPPCACSSSSYGRVIYTYHEDNLRFFPRIARGTEAWKTMYAKRTSVERSNKRKKIDYTLEATRVRSTVAWTWRSMLTAMCQHIDAWHAASGCKARDLINSWLPALPSPA